MLALFLTLLLGADPPPNLLLIVADDMGYGDLGSYGSLQVETPHLDRLAREGVRCTDAYVSAPVCAPSRAGLMTGRHGARFGFEHNLSTPPSLEASWAGIPLDEPLLSDRLHALGYRTGLVGKWHLGQSVPEHHPLERGFESFFGMLGGSHGYWPTADRNRLMRGHDAVDAIRVPYLTDWFTREALDFVEVDDERPWFLYLSYNTPHGPMQAREDDLARYEHIQDETRRIYCAMQHRMDVGIGQLIATLEARGELANTLIIFLSDNGGSVEVSHAVNAPLRGTKGTFLEGGIRVPMLLHWPAQLEPRVYSEAVSALDVMATMVAAAGGTPPPAGERVPRAGATGRQRPIYDSVDLTPYLRGEVEGAPHEALCWRMALRGSAIRVGTWKLIRPNSEFPQLYDLATDPGETHDLMEAEPERARALLDRLNRWEASFERNPLFISAPRWSDYNRRLYEKTYLLTQPAPDDAGDHWSFD